MLKRTLSVAMMAVLMMMSFSMEAQDKEAFKILENEEPSAIGNYVDLAMDLVQFGYDNNSAISLVQAAAIFTAVPVKSLDLKESPGGEKVDVIAPEYSYDPKVLMSDAKKMAQDDKELLNYITSVETRMISQTATRGESNYDVDSERIRIASGDTRVVYLYAPESGSKYSVRARGDGTSLRMTVSTVRGGENKGTVSGTSPYLKFWSAYAQDIKVVLTNNGGRSNDCTIILEKIADIEQRVEQAQVVVGVLQYLFGE